MKFFEIRSDAKQKYKVISMHVELYLFNLMSKYCRTDIIVEVNDHEIDPCHPLC